VGGVQVNLHGIRLLAADYASCADDLAVSAALALTDLPCQPTSAALNAVDSEVVAAREALTNRLTTMAGRFSAAASSYEGQEVDSAANLDVISATKDA
jgi:hypothetical protein